MPLTHTNQLFSRDLKHLVDPGYAVAPTPNFRPLLSVLAGIGAIAMVIGVGSLMLGPGAKPSGVNDSPRPVAEPAPGKPTVPQIATQIERAEKSPAQRVGDAGQSSPNESGPASDNSTKNLASSQYHDIGGDQVLIEWRDYTIKNGDSLARIFKNHGLNTGDAIRVAEHQDAGEIKTLLAGRKLRMGYDQDKKFRALSFELRSNRSLLVAFGLDGSLQFEGVQEKLDARQKTVALVIDSSLFKASAKAGLSDKLTLKLAGIFAWDIDFAKDLQPGDRFTVVYEQLVDANASRGEGDILATQFNAQGREFHAFRHVNDEGRVEYYDGEGQNLRGTFLRTPMKISRITSGFSKNRFHPVLKEWKEHKGVDYAAPRGTPVLATSDGRVSFLGNKNGYGKNIVLRHGSKYSTLYAHLSSYKSKIKPGSQVKQGQIIGFVGKTGMVTAPHLHYEFRVNGAHVDPLGYELPRAESVASHQQAEFLARAQKLMEAMSQHNTIQVARN